MKRVMAAAALLVLVACTRAPAVHVVAPDFFQVPPQRVPRSVRVVIYLVQDGRLAAVARTGQSSSPAAEIVMRALKTGPQTAERIKGITSEIPAVTEILGVSVRSKVATVDLSRAFESGAERRQALRLAQVVWSLTELPDVDQVRFRIDGQAEAVIDCAGRPHEVVARGRYQCVAPRSAEEPIIANGPLTEIEGTPAP